jgi:hypothetical protein
VAEATAVEGIVIQSAALALLRTAAALALTPGLLTQVARMAAVTPERYARFFLLEALMRCALPESGGAGPAESGGAGHGVDARGDATSLLLQHLLRERWDPLTSVTSPY